jgi:hypothetical protein
MHKNLYIILLFPFALHGQDYFKDHFGGTVGLTVNFGTHINAVGINLKGYYTDYFAQLNGTTTFYFYGKSIGNRNKYWESRNTIGLILLAGQKQMEVDFLLDGLNHQTKYNYGLGYNYVLYFDNAGTSQNSGSRSEMFGVGADQYPILCRRADAVDFRRLQPTTRCLLRSGGARCVGRYVAGDEAA